MAAVQGKDEDDQVDVDSGLLYVDGLYRVDNELLYNRFNKIGKVDCVGVCISFSGKWPPTRSRPFTVNDFDLGYVKGFVKYYNDQDAAKAREILNNTALNGRTIRVMIFHPDHIMHSSGDIFIKNLDKSVCRVGLVDTCSRYGNILVCEVYTGGYGFVRYDSGEGAQRAVDQLNGVLINDKQVFVARFPFTLVCVKNLSEATTETDLRNIFREFGRITSVGVMRDGDGKSKCFGFVDFQDADSAAKSIKALNGKIIGNGVKWYVGEAPKRPEREHKLKVRYEQSVNSSTDEAQGVDLYVQNQVDDQVDVGSGLLFVAGLHVSVDYEFLYNVFNKFGKVDSVGVSMACSGRERSTGHAYVKYHDVQDAVKATEKLNNIVLNNIKIRVMFFHVDHEMHRSSGIIYIKNLDKSVDCKRLHDTFSRYGNILVCGIYTGGDGFVRYDSGEGAQRAVDQLNGVLINDKQVFVARFPFTLVCVKNLSEATTETDLHNIFREFGRITSVVVMRDGDGKCKCFGFVNFLNADSAAKSIKALNGKIIGNGVKWYVGEARKRPEREHELKVRYEQSVNSSTDEAHGVDLNKSFRDVLLGDKGLERKKLEDLSNISGKAGVQLSKKTDDSYSTNGSYKGLDWKKLKFDVWSIKPITLNVTPGAEVILEDIILDKDVRVNFPSIFKEFHEEYKDKYVCILLLPMSSGHKNSTVLDTIRLRDVCDQIEASGGNFEVICIPTHFQAEEDFGIYNPYQQHLRIKFGTLFRHIHIDDSACLKRVESMIGLPKDPETTYIILSPTNGFRRKVVTIFDSDFIKWHGAEAFPFTTKKIQQLTREDEALRSNKHDLGTLLSVPDRDFVISNDLTKVPISDLHRKTVCLLFYEDNLECINWTKELKNLYETRKDFEVVVVFSITFGHGPNHSVEFGHRGRTLKFWKVFGDMPWLAIPLDDPKCRQLWRIFCRDSYSSKLLIIYSEGKYFEENGFEVLKKTGFESYPFMRDEVVRTSVAASREKNLSSFLRQKKLIRGGELDYDGREEFTVSKLFGAPVVFLFLGAAGFSDFLSDLRHHHVIARPTIDRFEIVYIPMMESPSDIVPDWVLVSSCKEELIPLFHHFFEDEKIQNPGKNFTMAVVTFGQFGHYNDRGIIYTNCSEEAFQLFLKTFPFKDDEEEEVFKTLREWTKKDG